MKYADLIIDNRTDSTDNFFTYGCEDDSIRPGNKVFVPFGRGNKEKEAYVFAVSDRPAGEFRNLKYITRADDEISLTEEMIEVCVWMKKRYMCRYIDAVKLFTPAGAKSKRNTEARPYKDTKGEAQDISELTEEQKKALDKLDMSIRGDGGLFLLHGVTGSGKTEVYMRAIQECVSRGRSAIMLVPEISLTKQIIDRFIGRFGREQIAVLHSRLTKRERYDEWTRIRNGEVKIVIGARSAVFAPFENIGIIVLDEEHESTYKSDKAPKYDTVEVAIKRVKSFGGTLLLGSATPSVATYERSLEGIYTRLELRERYNKNPLPEVETVDMREELRSGNTSIFSRKLTEGLAETFAKGQQAILFLNRRGYSTFVSCRECGYVMKCPDCGISLTYHKDRGKGICHYCGHEEDIPDVCPECGSRYIRYFGTGTERVEETVNELFGDVTTARLDMDVMKKKGAMSRILSDFGKGRIDVLTGTQVVAKGLDFRNVGIVGIISADVTLNIPDYRSPERCFQLITQAAGRAGRGDTRGRVIIQTYTPESYAVKSAAGHDYEGFFEKENMVREMLGYPPYGDLMQLVIAGKDLGAVEKSAAVWRNGLCAALGETGISMPQRMTTAAEKEGYKFYILIKCPKGRRNEYMAALEAFKEKEKKTNTKAGKQFKCLAAVDVNPYSIGRS